MLPFRNSLPNLKCRIRILNADTNGAYHDVYINNSILGYHLRYGSVSGYAEISPGEQNIDIFDSDEHNNTAHYSDKIELLPNTDYTVFINVLDKKLMLIPVIDGFPNTKSDMSNLRFINLSRNSPLLSVQIKNGPEIFDGVEYLERSSYYTLPPKTYNIILTSKEYPPYMGHISDITLESGKYYTLYSLGNLYNTPKFGYLLVEDGTIT